MAPTSGHHSPQLAISINSGSSRSHVVNSSCEAPRLLSPNQPQRASLENERDRSGSASTVDDHINDGNETQALHSPGPLNPTSMSNEAKDERFAAPESDCQRASQWKSVAMIMGFLFAGQFKLARKEISLTVYSSSFSPRSLSSCQELRRHTYRYKLPNAIPSLRGVNTLYYDIQSCTSG